MIGHGDPRAETVALAGLYQSLEMVQELARGGAVQDPRAFHCSLESLLRIDADSALAVYGGVQGIQAGLRRLREQPARRVSPEGLEQARYAANLMVLERRLHAEPARGLALASAITAFAARCAGQDLDAAPQVEELAGLYTEHVSPLGPKVMVSGEPAFLQRESIAARIRAMLLCGFRAIVLWRQSGGGRVRMLLLRKRYAAIAGELLTQPTGAASE